MQSPINLNNVKTVMVFGAHPDDEVIGPGGIIHNLSVAGKKIVVITFTGGGTAANSPGDMQSMIEQRKKETKETDKILGIKTHIHLPIPTQQVFQAAYGNIMISDKDNPSTKLTLHQTLIKLIRKYKPDILFSHAPDNHRDHEAIARITPQAVFQAQEALLEHLGKPWDTPILLYYNVDTALHHPYEPNIIIQISREDLNAKLDAISHHKSQTRGDYLQHFKDIIDSRARLWGARHFRAGRLAEPYHLHKTTAIRISLPK